MSLMNAPYLIIMRRCAIHHRYKEAFAKSMTTVEAGGDWGGGGGG